MRVFWRTGLSYVAGLMRWSAAATGQVLCKCQCYLSACAGAPAPRSSALTSALAPVCPGRPCRFAELERSLGEAERARAIYELAIAQPVLDMPEAIWKVGERPWSGGCLEPWWGGEVCGAGSLSCWELGAGLRRWLASMGAAGQRSG